MSPAATRNPPFAPRRGSARSSSSTPTGLGSPRSHTACSFYPRKRSAESLSPRPRPCPCPVHDAFTFCPRAVQSTTDSCRHELRTLLSCSASHTELLCFTRENAPRIRNWNLRRPSTSFRSRRALHHERFISHGKLVLVSPWSLFAPHDTICFAEIHRKTEKGSPHTGRRARRRLAAAVSFVGWVDDTLRALLRVLSTQHRWCLRFVRLPFPPRAFVPVVTSPSITSRFFDRRRGGRGSGERGGGIFRDGKDFRQTTRKYFRQEGSQQAESRDGLAGEVCGSSPFRHFATCAFVSDT